MMKEIVIYAALELCFALGTIVGFHWIGASVKSPLVEFVAFGSSLLVAIVVALSVIQLGQTDPQKNLQKVCLVCLLTIIFIFFAAIPRLAWNVIIGRAFALGFLFRVTFYVAVASLLFSQLQEVKGFVICFMVYAGVSTLILYVILWIHQSVRRLHVGIAWLFTLVLSIIVAAMLSALEQGGVSTTIVSELYVLITTFLMDVSTIPKWSTFIGGVVYVIAIGLFARYFANRGSAAAVDTNAVKQASNVVNELEGTFRK